MGNGGGEENRSCTLPYWCRWREFLNSIGAHVLHLVQDEIADDNTFIDLEERYTHWFEQNDCVAVLVRPDFYVFGAVRRLEEVPNLVADLQIQLMFGI